MTTPVLATKLFVPTTRPRLVARPRLTTHLDATLAAGHRLTLVSAPAGFGKTTVLGDWLARLAQRDQHTRVGWLSLDAGDNDLVRLMTHLVASLHSAGLDVSPVAPEALATGLNQAALTVLINDITLATQGSPGEQWVLVLDDYHVIDAAAVHEVLAFVVEHLPAHLHLVVATRADPPLPLARLRSSGQLTEVRAADLRFTPAEALEFCNQTMALDLEPSDVEALEERTEGWIAGLQLAALSLRGLTERRGIAEFIEAFAGSNRFVIDYLADEVLARQTSDLREFLLDTSILDRLTGPLCSAVTGGTDGTQMLTDLERSNLFVVPLDAERRWYRYHHLFADVLRARLHVESPGRLPVLHRRASEWFATQGMVEDAVRHALSAEDFERAAHLMEDALPQMRRNRRDGVLLGWVRSLPETTVRSRPVLAILSGWSLMLDGDLDGAESRFDDAEAALEAGLDDPTLAAAWADTEDLRTAPATVAVYRASMAQARGDVAGTMRHARRALDLARPEDHLVRGAGGGFLGLAQWAAGNVHEGLSLFTEAGRSLRAAGNVVDELDSTVMLADMWVAAGRPSRARRLCEQALETANRGGNPYLRAAADLHVALAELDREVNDLTGADALLETARVLGERTSITENRHRWFIAMAQVRAARGDHGSAKDLFDQAEALFRPGFYPDVRPVAAMKARVQIAAGELAAATAWAQERDLSVDDEAEFLREYEHLTLTRLLLAQNRAAPRRGPAGTDPLEASLGLLDRLHAAAAATGRGGSLLEIRLLQALTHQARGDLPHALDALALGLGETSEPHSHVRLFLDEGAPMLALLDRAALDTTPSATEARVTLREHARRLLDGTPPTMDAAVSVPLVTP